MAASAHLDLNQQAWLDLRLAQQRGVKVVGAAGGRLATCCVCGGSIGRRAPVKTDSGTAHLLCADQL